MHLDVHSSIIRISQKVKTTGMSSTGGHLINGHTYTHIVEDYSTTKKNEILINATT